MYEAAQASDRTTMVAFNYRRTPAITYAKKLIDEGRIGKILNFRGTYLQDWSASPDSPLSWRFRKDIAGSGALGDIGTHVVDIARYLVGEISAVSAQARTWIPERPVPSGTVDKLGAGGDANAPKEAVDVDDEVMTMLRPYPSPASPTTRPSPPTIPPSEASARSTPARPTRTGKRCGPFPPWASDTAKPRSSRPTTSSTPSSTAPQPALTSPTATRSKRSPTRSWSPPTAGNG